MLIYRWIMQVVNDVVASGGYYRPTKDSAEFATGGHIGQLFLIVKDPFRGNGYSKTLISEITESAKNDGITKFQHFARNKDAISLSNKLGATKAQRVVKIGYFWME